MPRVALIVQDFINKGTYMTSQSYMQESVWHNVPWGPSLVFFYSFFLIISPDPLIVSSLLTMFHMIGIVLIIKLGWKYFSPSVGVISGLLLATNPYWFIYSRIIYQPAPVITFIVISMYLLLSSLKDSNKLSIVLLPISWVILFQIYIPTYIFIFLSLVFIIFNIKKKNFKFFIFGMCLSLFLVFPSIKFYNDNPIYIDRFIDAPSRFRPSEVTYAERFIKVFESFVTIPLGGKFDWQTGYGFNDFVVFFPLQDKVSYILSIVLILILLKSFVDLFTKNLNTSRLFVFLSTILVVISLMLLWVDELVPRYFLIAIPPMIVMMSIFINDLMIKVYKLEYFSISILVLPIMLSIYWTIFNIKYDIFIKTYEYKKGMMVDVAQTPYKLFKSTMDDLDREAIKNGCTKYQLTNNLDNPSFDLWMETRYVWDYIYKYNYVIDSEQIKNCSYLITNKEVINTTNLLNIQKKGLYSIYKIIY